MSTAHLLCFFFDGGGLASVSPPVAKKLVIKPKRRKFTLENGVTVWATSEAMARLFAGLDDVPAITPDEEGHREAGEVGEAGGAIDPRSGEAGPATDPDIDFKVNTARLNTLELRRRREAVLAVQAQLAESAVAAQLREAERAAIAAEAARVAAAKAAAEAAAALAAEQERQRARRLRAEEDVILQVLMDDPPPKRRHIPVSGARGSREEAVIVRMLMEMAA